MHAIFALMRLFPYWGLVIALASVEFALFFRRRGKAVKTLVCGCFAGIFLALISLWFYYRGDLHAETWIRAWLGS